MLPCSQSKMHFRKDVLLSAGISNRRISNRRSTPSFFSQSAFVLPVILAQGNATYYHPHAKKTAHSTRLCAAFKTAILLKFFILRPFVWGGRVNLFSILGHSIRGAKVLRFF